MYHCHMHFYFIGPSCRAFEIIREMSPLQAFTHEFSESKKPDPVLVAEADVILANLSDYNGPEELRPLILAKSGETELILLAGEAMTAALAGEGPGSGSGILVEENDSAKAEGILPGIDDIWRLPMTDEEIRFRFFRWQKACKEKKDFWQTSHYLEATINHVPNLVWYKDKNGIHEKVNDSFCRTVGKTKKQVEGQGHAYIWDVEEDDPACIESERVVMEKQETCVSEECVQTGDGTKLLTTYKSPLYDLDGSVMGTVGVAIDVTQERAYEQEIIQKNHTLETIFTTMDCGVMWHTVDGSRIVSVNRAALEILGYSSQEELESDGFDMVANSVVEEDKGTLRRAIKELKKEGDSASVEYRVQHKNGDILHVMGNIKFLREDGEPLYQRFLLDCTAQKLQEKEHERRQMELVHALSMDYTFVCFFDLNTGMGYRIRHEENGDPRLEAVFEGELFLDDRMERYVEEFVYEEDQNAMREMVSRENLRKELEEHKQCYMNYRTVRDGDVKYFQIKVVRTGEWSETHGIVLGFRSVDQEIRNEMEQKSLLENALMQANRANRAKSAFLSNMSHDIRTPMNAIVGFTALALTHIERQEQVKEYLKKIMTSGNHLLSLINDVLDMSRIESGKMHLEEKPCSLPDILHGLRNIVQADIHAKQLEFYIDTVDVLDEEIYCDKLRLNQVLLNLLSNSIKYTGMGGIITMRIIEKPGAPAGYANYEFHIRDTGIGMSEEFISHIFEPFEREKNTTISGIQGTGLGMAITKNIVDMMNGSISVKSEEGAGTEFVVAFTFRLDASKKEPKDIPELKNCRALVVDDDFNSCDTVSCMLKEMGLRAEWTLSGKEAVLRTRQASMRGDEYGVYIIDWFLPDMNGIEVARRIRKEMDAEVPIIVLTAYDWADIEEEAKEAGVSAFCSKPLFLSELRNCLYSIVNAEEGRGKHAEKELAKLPTGRILLAEDNELNQEIAAEILADAGFSVDVAGNGKIAVEMLERSEPGYYQLVLMDVQMPVMNGHEAARIIRNFENRELAAVPILAMTANAFEEDKQAALACGMNGHIAKPIDVEKLLETLGKVLAEQSA